MIPPPNPLTFDGIVACVTANVPIDASTLAVVGSGPRWNGLAAAAADVPPLTKANAMLSAATARAIRDLVPSTALYPLPVRGFATPGSPRSPRGSAMQGRGEPG